jgi:hypothetical protein
MCHRPEFENSTKKISVKEHASREKEYLFALATIGNGPQRSGAIAEVLHASSKTVAPVRNSLIKKGMIYSPAHGTTDFTVPLFGVFLKRISSAI